jgi:hypothetical protein
MALREPTEYSPDSTLEGVSPQDILSNAIENRHLADNEVNAAKLATVAGNEAPLVTIQAEVTEGAATVSIFDADAPFKFEIVDIIVQARGASTNGTMKITDGTNDISDAITCAVDKVVSRAGTLDAAYSTIAAGGTLVVVCAGDAVASTVGLVTIVATKVD